MGYYFNSNFHDEMNTTIKSHLRVCLPKCESLSHTFCILCIFYIIKTYTKKCTVNEEFINHVYTHTNLILKIALNVYIIIMVVIYTFP